MVGWHHQLNGDASEQTPGVDGRQGGLECCSPWGCKELETTEQLNNTNGAKPNSPRGSFLNQMTRASFLCIRVKWRHPYLLESF